VRLWKLAKYWLPALLWLALVLVASSDLMSGQQTSRIIGPLLRWLMPNVTPETIATLQFGVRKIAHVTEYAILAALLTRAARAGAERLVWAHVVVALAIAATCAISDEFHQSLLASRHGTVTDVMLDLLGALIGVALYWRFTRRRKVRE
jgi:VanZ family protein